ncbi:hypothetical protein SAMD00019534_034510 [Acytostelium subglobosum LB1]|uniref:hypothetical protein n=1 Tax=Acytostelium subglobosum LB1 TaxID=1410327 RepID=UPI00064518DE|nr:hypothetical protein SAMD00019534_034510 [Acytostelium subglobosum LB1]GAM20276.1 hypothetical protein SAMD00019534_034510 [Acytostelium subglobosum LB1]|eukprot:XP_012759797.1 hypothetical protein SAMD00019534_034510 [Acytostelium subglobosum LB1]
MFTNSYNSNSNGNKDNNNRNSNNNNNNNSSFGITSYLSSSNNQSSFANGPSSLSQSGRDHHNLLSASSTSSPLSMNGTGMHSGYGSGISLSTSRSGSSQDLNDESSNLKELEESVERYKKENFSLKTKIFYMQESLKNGGMGDATVVELNIRIKELTTELEERNKLLVKLRNALEGQNEKMKNCVCDFGKNSAYGARGAAATTPVSSQDDLRKIRQLEESLKQANSMNDLLKGQLQRSQQQMHQQQQQQQPTVDTSAYDKIIDEYKDQVARLTVMLNNKDQMMQHANNNRAEPAELRMQKERIQALEDNNQQMKREYTTLWNQHKQMLDGLERSNNSANDRSAQLQRQLDDATHKYDTLFNKSEVLVAQLERVKNKCLEFERAINDKDVELASLIASDNALREELMFAKQGNDAEDRYRAEEITALRGQIKRLKDKRDQMAEEGAVKESAMTNNIEELKMRNQTLSSERAELVERNEEARLEIKNLRTDVDKYRQEKIDTSKMLDDVEREYRELRVEVAESMKKRENMDKDRSTLLQNYEDINKRLLLSDEKLRRTEDELRRAVAQKKADMAETLHQHEHEFTSVLLEVLDKVSDEIGLEGSSRLRQNGSTHVDIQLVKNMLFERIDLLQMSTKELLSTTIGTLEQRLDREMDGMLELVEHKLNDLNNVEQNFNKLRHTYSDMVNQYDADVEGVRRAATVEYNTLRQELTTQLARKDQEINGIREQYELKLMNYSDELENKKEELANAVRRQKSGIQAPSESAQMSNLRQELAQIKLDHQEAKRNVARLNVDKARIESEANSRLQQLKFNHDIEIQSLEKEVEHLKRLQRQWSEAPVHATAPVATAPATPVAPSNNLQQSFYSSMGLAIDTIDLHKTPSRVANLIETGINDYEDVKLARSPAAAKYLIDRFRELDNENHITKDMINKVDDNIKLAKMKSPAKTISYKDYQEEKRERESKKQDAFDSINQHINFLNQLMAQPDLATTDPNFTSKMGSLLKDVKTMEVKRKLLVHELQSRSKKLDYVVDSYNNLVQGTPTNNNVVPIGTSSKAYPRQQQQISTTPLDEYRSTNTQVQVPLSIHHTNNNNDIVTPPSANGFQPLTTSQLGSGQMYRKQGPAAPVGGVNNQKAVTFSRQPDKTITYEPLPLPNNINNTNSKFTPQSRFGATATSSHNITNTTTSTSTTVSRPTTDINKAKLSNLSRKLDHAESKTTR